MEVITYSLREGQQQSALYYRCVVAFTDEVLAEAEERTRPLVEAFRAHLRRARRELPRSFPEHTFELLTLGVLWRIYLDEALALNRGAHRTLTCLVQARRRAGRLKPAIDFVRGVLGRLLLLPSSHRPIEVPTPTLARLDRLLGWLAATGDFTQEVRRLRTWQGFLLDQPPEETNRHLAVAISFAAWFDARSQAVLGRYTPNVERFLAETHPSYRWREDAVFCGRWRVEYHLNMVGTEILNRAFRKAFLGTTRKVVLLPPCMKARPDERCRARPTPYGARCVGCTLGCRVQQVTKLGEKYGFEVLILPEELSVFSSGTIEPMEGDEVGIVGVSCVLTNPSGGWETRDLGIPAQGVLLDYCGCRYHWHREGIPTDVDVDRLLKVLGIDTDASCEVQDGG